MSETTLPRRTPPFLIHLGLDTQADDRAIRRAYAQRLKRIDQASDAQGFQALREAYEAALQWAAWRQRQVDLIEAQGEVPGEVPAMLGAEVPGEPGEAIRAIEPEIPAVDQLPAPPPAPSRSPRPESTATASAESLSRAVFEELVAMQLAGFETTKQASGALVRALSDDRLVNLEARTMFEWHVACLLAGGWQPGHELLFEAACDVFHWEKERRTLSPFGRVGAHLDAAIGEALVLSRYPVHEANAYRRAIQRLRRADMPGASELRQLMPALRILAQRHPNWLSIVSPQATWQRWNDIFRSLPREPLTAMPQGGAAGATGRAAQPAADLRGVPAKPADKGGFPWWVKIIFVLVVLHALAKFASPSHTSSDPRGKTPWYAPVAVDPDPGSERPGRDAWPGRVSQNADGNMVWEATRAASAPPREPASPRDLVRRQREAEEALAAVLAEARSQPASAPR